MSIKPLHDKVLIKRVDEETKTAGGIIIPDTAQEKPSEGIVEAVGNGFRAEDGKILPMSVKVGDRVLFGKWAGTEIKMNGETRLIVKESDILAIVE
jgi:chaperonin GroES